MQLATVEANVLEKQYRVFEKRRQLVCLILANFWVVLCSKPAPAITPTSGKLIPNIKDLFALCSFSPAHRGPLNDARHWLRSLAEIPGMIYSQWNLGRSMRSILMIVIILFATYSARATPTSIVPGRSLGRIQLSSTRSDVHGVLGPPSDPGYGDYEYYYSGKDKNTTLIICYHYGVVVEIITNSPKFSTSSHISIRSSFAQIKRSNRNFKKSACEEQEVCAYVLDDVARGLAYQFKAPALYVHGKITAGFLASSARPVWIAIHMLGKPWSGYTSSY